VAGDVNDSTTVKILQTSGEGVSSYLAAKEERFDNGATREVPIDFGKCKQGILMRLQSFT